MMMLPSLFTLAEADGLVPHLEAGVAAAKVAIVRAHALRTELMAGLQGNGHDLLAVQDERPELVADIEDAEAEGQEELELLARLGIVLTSLEPAEASVLSRRGLEQVALCWREGEPGFTHWHGLQESRELMRPIDDPAAFGGAVLPT